MILFVTFYDLIILKLILKLTEVYIGKNTQIVNVCKHQEETN